MDKAGAHSFSCEHNVIMPPSENLTGRSEANFFRTWYALCLLAALPWALYGITVGAGFFFLDDEAFFWLRNPVVDDGNWSGIFHVWMQRHQGYMPLMNLTVWLDHALDFHAHPWIIRVQSLAWASLCVLGARSLIERITGRPGLAWALAALFICHPLSAPSILWPAMRRKLLFLTWAFWGLSWLIKGWRANELRQSWLWIALGIMGCTLSLSANFHAVVLAPIILLLGFALQKRPWGNLRILFVVFVFGALVTLYAGNELRLSSANQLQGRSLGGGGWGILLADGPIFRDYLLNLVWPWKLTYYYGVREQGSFDWINLSSWATVIAVVATTVLLHPNRARALFFWLLAGICMLPVMNISNFPFAMADHYFQPSAFILMWLSVDLVDHYLQLVDRKVPSLLPWRTWACFAMLAYAIPASIMRIPTFTSSIRATLWAVHVQPLSAIHKAYFVSVACQGTQPKWILNQIGPQARLSMLQADTFRVPGYLLARLGLIEIEYLSAQNRLAEADQLWDILEKSIDDKSLIGFLRGATAFYQGNYAKAEAALTPLIVVDEAFMERIWNRCAQGELLPTLVKGGFNDSSNLMRDRSSANLFGDESDLLNQKVMYLVACTYANTGRLEGAAKLCVVSLAINPRFYPAWSLLAEIQGARGRLKSAGTATKRFYDLIDELGAKLSPGERIAFDLVASANRPRNSILESVPVTSATELKALNFLNSNTENRIEEKPEK